MSLAKYGGNHHPKVSVIVPMFNVEAFIRQCADSITSQSHNNLEIILVDDGSQDASGAIADELSARDTRIKVIHQKNAGVSMARNAGLDEASGEFVCFVDGDDWVARDFVQHLLSLALEHNADLALSKSVLTSQKPNGAREEHVELWTAERGTTEFLYARVIIGCWNKLFRRSLIENNRLRFLPQYFMGEGLNFITSASQLATKIVATDRPIYFYRRDNAESATSKVSIEKYENALAAIANIRANTIIKSRHITLALDFHQWLTSFYAMRIALATNYKEKHQEFYEECLRNVTKESFRMLTTASIPIRQRLLASAAWISPLLAIKLVDCRGNG